MSSMFANKIMRGRPRRRKPKAQKPFLYEDGVLYYDGEPLRSKSFVKIVSNNYGAYAACMLQAGEEIPFVVGRLFTIDKKEYIITQLKRARILYTSHPRTLDDRETYTTYKQLQIKLNLKVLQLKEIYETTDS